MQINTFKKNSKFCRTGPHFRMSETCKNTTLVHSPDLTNIKEEEGVDCMQDTFARARTRRLGILYTRGRSKMIHTKQLYLVLNM